MNAAVRAAVRFGISRGHKIAGIHDGFPGLLADRVEPLGWEAVEGWNGLGGAELGTSRTTSPTVAFAGGGRPGAQQLDGLLIIGGWDAFEAACTMQRERARYPAFQVPTIYLPATIDNNIPTSELSVGADSALSLIVDSIDRVRQAGIATRRCFVVETMGGQCGYLAVLLGGLSRRRGARLPARGGHHAPGAGRRRAADGRELPGRPAALPRRDEREGQPDVHQRLPVPGVRPGEPGAVRRPRGRPGPDPAARRPRSTVLAGWARHSIDWLSNQIGSASPGAAVIGLSEGKVRVRPLRDAEELALGQPDHRGAVPIWLLSQSIECAASRVRGLDRLAQQPDRQRQPRRRGDRAVRGQGPGAAIAGRRGAGRLGAPASTAAVVDAAAADDRRAGRPARPGFGAVGLTPRGQALAWASRSARRRRPYRSRGRSSRRRGPRSGPRPRRRRRSARPGRRCAEGRWRPARWPSGRRRRPGSWARRGSPTRRRTRPPCPAPGGRRPARPGGVVRVTRPSTRRKDRPPPTDGGHTGHSSSRPGSTGRWTWRMCWRSNIPSYRGSR